MLGRMRGTDLLRKHWIYPAMVLAVTILVFSQSRFPLLFLVFPFLVLVLTRIDLGWAALSTLIVAVIGGWFTVHHSGPLALSVGSGVEWQAAILQLYLA